MIVLDTNVISELQGRTHSERILNWLDAHDVESLFLTTIAVAEMRYGLELLDDGRRKATLTSDFKRIESEFAGRILGFSLSAANRYGLLGAQLRKARRPMETKDAMIAAICLANGATLATRNTRDFEGLDLKLLNPFEDG
ncbi:type II toxin-antitoxin system VapC family toxin [Rhizobium phaseoli]|uniref:type II toxin-antitoxin system VapC family toxin n=1 Tax=Rhizobium phaseoli TaxID=396 RepID=UPI0007E9A78A|nr:type II toxin-antitoxin system VapC family toxin [Rhizobium phaseoli]ANL32571.1 toxin/antitoxin system PilT domain-containing protein [Rhizobium phaseoli]ANL96302.1 toxin/antitoxin system PilT domain-containing protein [Rhizobium phaseoli]